MKYKAIIETDEFEDFEFFEDGNGKYMVGKDAGATTSGGWIPLYFTECKQESEVKITFEEVKEMFKKSIDATDTMNQALENLIQSIYLKGYNEALAQDPCDDCISREDTLARLRADTSFVCTGDKLQAIEIVNNMSPVTPKQKGNKMTEKRIIMFQCCNDLNDINTAILNNHRDWEGLHTAEDIISITYNSNHNCYVVSWINRDYTVEG